MGKPNSRRLRRRRRGKYRQFYANHVWWGGRWLVRTIAPVEVIDIGNGFFVEKHNETWNPPEVLDLIGHPAAEGASS